MSPRTNEQEQPQRSQQTGASGSSPVPSGPTVNQRMGLVIISLAFLVFLVNIMASLSSAFGPVGSAIGLAAVCLTVLGLNIAFNLDVFRSRQ